MAVKHFCDICGDELTERNSCTGGSVVNDRLGITRITKAGKLQAELLLTWNGTANAGEFCKYCVLDTFTELDDRPKAAEGR